MPPAPSIEGALRGRLNLSSRDHRGRAGRPMQGADSATRPPGGPSVRRLAPHPRRSRSRLPRRHPGRGRQHARDRLRRPDLRVRRPPGRQQGARGLGDARDDRRAGGDRRPRRRLDRARRHERRARAESPSGSRPASRRSPSDDTSQMYYEVTVAGSAAEVRRARLEHRRRRLAQVRRARDGRPEVAGGASGSTASRSARRSTCPAATTAGTRRRSPRTGTAAPAPATPTRTASRTSRSRSTTAASGAR